MGFEISQSRWYQLSSEEKNKLRTFERWNKSFKEFFSIFSQLAKVVFGLFANKPKKTKGKKWVRSDLQPIEGKTADDLMSKKDLPEVKKQEEITNTAIALNNAS